MELLEQLELVDITFEDKKAVLTFLDEERGEIREVNLNQKSYDNDKGEFVADPVKAEKVEGWCKEYFGLTFDELARAIGERKDIYAYERFNSLFPVKMVAKFDKSMVGQIMEITVSNVIDDGKAIHIEFEYEGDTYENKMTYADYLETKKTWYVNPQKQSKQYEKFEEKFGFPVSEKEKLIGMNAMIEIKMAFKKFVYVDIKAFRVKKK